MHTSETIKEITTALVKFHQAVGSIKKDAKNPFFKMSYASLSQILETIDEPLSANGLVLVQFPEGENSLTTRVLHTSGEWLESSYNMKPVKETPQDRGSCLTYQRRYAIGAILSLNISDDDDGNSASGRTNGQAVNQPAKQPTAQAVHPNDIAVLKEKVNKIAPENQAGAFKSIEKIVTYEQYKTMDNWLDQHQVPFDQIKNPNQKDIKKQVNAIAS